jgi:hypothetical protein
MLKEIIDGISLKLNQVFGDGYEIYGDTNIVQGLKEPCFFIVLLNPTHTQFIGQRYFRNNPFMIQYFPKNEEDNIEMHDVASELFEALEYITLSNGDSLQGTSMNYEIIDGVLHFKVNYNMILTKKEFYELMEELKYRGLF